VPDSIDDRIFAKIYDGVTRFRSMSAAIPAMMCEHRSKSASRPFAGRLRDDPEMIAKGEQLKEELLAHPDVRAWMESLWRDAKRGLIEATSQPKSELNQRITTALVKLGARLAAEPELQAKIDHWVTSAVGYVIDNYRTEVSKLIESTVARWDGESTSRKLELQVGRDLQFHPHQRHDRRRAGGLEHPRRRRVAHLRRALREIQPTTLGSGTYVRSSHWK